MPAAEYIPDPTASCSRCGKPVFFDELDGVWRTASAEARVVCPTGGPHSVTVPKVNWDSFEDVLASWEDDSK